jgi:5-enolpyruvylshikimate-3-phosphate synthase
MKIEGALSIVGDKSLSHRAVILCSLASGVSRIKNILLSGDTKATIQIFRQLGVEINEINNNEVEVHGVGLHGLRQPEGPLNAVNSGTYCKTTYRSFVKAKFQV